MAISACMFHTHPIETNAAAMGPTEAIPVHGPPAFFLGWLAFFSAAHVHHLWHSTSPAREKAMVVNLEFIRAIVTVEEAYTGSSPT